MDKKEARINCSGCGASYKIKIPVTDKPVSFKCKKCGKLLKLRIKASSTSEAARPPEKDVRPLTDFETTQLPDTDNYQDQSGAAPKVTDFLPELEFAQPADVRPVPAKEDERQWLVLADDLIQGPFTRADIRRMIKQGKITPQTSLRMGDRPWVQAAELPEFRDTFASPRKISGTVALETISLLGKEGQEEAGEVALTAAPFYKQLPAILSYPVGGGKPIPFAIFTGIVFVLSALLSFDLLIGFLLNLIGWILLYGYLSELLKGSMLAPTELPPSWNFAGLQKLLANGLSLFVVLLGYVIVPLTLILLAMAYCFLNDEALIGYVLMGVAVLLYLGAVFVLPVQLVTLCASGNLGAALSPGRIPAVVTKGGQAYRMLGMISLAAGLSCLAATMIGILLLVELPVGFVISGLLMAVVLSYAHFVWFHAMGRFAAENKRVVSVA
jgi:hypothetical protein